MPAWDESSPNPSHEMPLDSMKRPRTEKKPIHEVEEKVERICQYLHAEKLAAVLLTSRRNFSWVTNGATNHVRLGSEVGVASLLILDSGRRYVLAGNNEMPRISNEEVHDLGFEPVQFDWHEPEQKQQLVRKLVAGRAFGSDIAFPDARVIEDEIARMRYTLSDQEIARYREVGRFCASAVEEVCHRLQPGMTEIEIGGHAAEALLRRGLQPTVLLVASDERIYQYRHPVPTERRVERYGMVSVNAQKWGLIASLTRCVHFGPVPQDLIGRHRAACSITAHFMANTRPGRRATEIFERMQGWYAEAGYPDEWRKHHQGGAIGYKEREWLLAPELHEVVHERQAFAWNPTIAGAKDEDTMIVLGDHAELLTSTGEWPAIDISAENETFPRPSILQR